MINLKRIVSLLLVCTLLFSFSSLAFAEDGGKKYETAIVYEGIQTEYSISVPAEIKPGETKQVSVAGYWPTDMVVNVSVPEKVELVNTRNSNDKIELKVKFNSISQFGEGSSSVSVTEDLTLEGVSGKLYGTWEGYIIYDVLIDTKENPNAPVTVNYKTDGNGSVNKESETFKKGSNLTFPTTTPEDGYIFDKWVDFTNGVDGEEVTTSTIVNSNMTVKATFKENAPLTFETAKIGEEFQFGYYNMAFNDERDIAGVIVVNTAQGGTIPITWVKVSDTLAICKDILRSTISWNRLNSAGFTTNWPLSIDNVLTYKVRLLKGGSNGEVGKPVTGGEWKTYVVDQGLQKSFNWQSSYFWCQESSAMYQGSINSKYSPQIDWRGYWCCDLKSESEDGGFRPVLERIR